MDWLEALILGVVQGLTEFLPVSSDGHLAVFQMLFAHWTGRGRSGAENLFFDVMLHLGTLAAILVQYRRPIAAGARGLLGVPGVPEVYRRSSILRIGLLAMVGTLPLIPDALYFKKAIEQAFDSPLATGIGFLITAAVLALTTRLRGGDKGPETTTWLDALAVGIAQAFAPLPGVSRSGLTIAAALALGFRKTWAVGFSLLIAVPAILGATIFEVKDVDPAYLSSERILQTVIATVVAGLVGYVAIVWLVRVVRSGRLWYFSVYLVVLAAAVLVLAGLSKTRTEKQPDARQSRTVVGPAWSVALGAPPGARADRAVRPMARPLRDGSRAGPPPADAPASGRLRPARLVLG
ncbi:MAG: undecaprenyl-diphosphate phosphatase [Isosphaeraceae bacterium]|nr:undecaprenyl-diphosphate phosphatase [Isosphaeraceae bacterium]